MAREWRSKVRGRLQRTGLIVPALRAWSLIAPLTNPRLAKEWSKRHSEFKEFERHHANLLRERLGQPALPGKRVLIVSGGFAGVTVELGFLKALELAGCETVVLTRYNRWLDRYYRASAHAVRYWEEFESSPDAGHADVVMRDLSSLDELLALERGGVRVGRYAASTALRELRVGSLDCRRLEDRAHIVDYLASAVAGAKASTEIVRAIRPDVVVLNDRGYTPHGQLSDTCVAEDIPVVTWNAAHRSSALVLKRYTRGNRDEHPSSLSDSSWHTIRHMPWTGAHSERVREELQRTYSIGDWYSEVGTQFHARSMRTEEVVARLSLDPAKRTAVIFPHILWDATFFWGTDLFGNYEEWLVQTVKAACANDRVNWIIKVHPGNLVKNARDGVSGEASELVALRKHVGELPRSVRVIPADSEIGTFPLFAVMDYCVTVRGTVGIEAASFGIPVLTAGTGRYDRRGFTIDSETPEEYLGRIASIETIPRLTSEQRQLAERFAYGVFIMRPLGLTSVTQAFNRDRAASLRSRINIRTKADWHRARDLKAFAEWVVESTDEDFLDPAVGLEFPA